MELEDELQADLKKWKDVINELIEEFYSDSESDDESDSDSYSESDSDRIRFWIISTKSIKELFFILIKMHMQAIKNLSYDKSL